MVLWNCGVDMDVDVKENRGEEGKRGVFIHFCQPLKHD